MAMIFEFSWFLARLVFANLDKPFAFLFIPVAADDLCIKVHVLAEIESFHNLLEVREDVRGFGEELRPVRVLCCGVSTVS